MDLLKNIEPPHIAPVCIFPTISWFMHYVVEQQKLCLSNKIYTPKSFSGNRFVLIGPNKISSFSVPLQKESLGAAVSDVLISNQSKWLKELKNTLQTIYGKTSYFEYYDYKLWDVFEKLQDEKLLNLALGTLGWAHKALQWDVEITLTDHVATELLTEFEITPYPQPFMDRFGFVQNATVFDIIFCLGPEAALRMRY